MSTTTSSRKARGVKKGVVDRDKALLMTSSVPADKGFHFFTDFYKPTGMFATSVFEFADQLKKVDLRSIEFHVQRNDFSKWLKEVIRDDWLANEFGKLQGMKSTGDKLRSKVVSITEKRCRELSEALKSIGH
jgi:alpha-amylase